MKANQCRYCYKEIRDRDELVTASNWFRVRPYHYTCFGLLEKETNTIANTWNPINGATGLVTVLIMILLAAIMFITNLLGNIGDLLGILALYPVLLRILSFLLYERPLPKYIRNKPRQ